jgi:glycosyltransferase involved in cell wall biosynthesis
MIGLSRLPSIAETKVFPDGRTDWPTRRRLSDMNRPMRLLIAANSFYPAVGGYERVAFAIAQQLASRGHQIKIVTFTPGGEDADLPFEIHRAPPIGTLFKLIHWCDIYVQNNVSFKLLWPLLLRWRPLVCVHHGFYGSSTNTKLTWTQRLKQLATLLSTNISVSRAIADTLPGRSHVALNPYRDDIFYRIPGIQKDRDLFFVGRIVSDKGIDVLIDAVAKLRDRGLRPSLTVAGSGPEEPAIRRRVDELQLQDLVTFAGRVPDDRLNELLNAHKIMVVPTREGEGFGVVALEGIACGCVVVGSTCGGLPEAIGPCGRTFPSGDPSALADLLFELLTHPETWNDYFIHAKAHLDAHRPSAVTDRYLEVLTRVLGKGDVR